MLTAKQAHEATLANVQYSRADIGRAIQDAVGRAEMIAVFEERRWNIDHDNWLISLGYDLQGETDGWGVELVVVSWKYPGVADED